MNARKLQALRNLAERPGTEAEGQLAREKLARYERESGKAIPLDIGILRDYLRNGDTESFLRAMREQYPLSFRCQCGGEKNINQRCQEHARHEAIRVEVHRRFKRGDRVYYNRWAYKKNCPGTVTGFPTPRARGYSQMWGWVNVKFDHLKAARAVPVLGDYADGLKWGLTHEPVPDSHTGGATMWHPEPLR